MIEEMKPVRSLQIGDLVRHKEITDPELEVPLWSGCYGIVLDLPKMQIEDVCSYPTIYWDDGETGTVRRECLEIVAVAKNGSA